MVVDLMVPRSLDVEIDGEVITFAGEDRRLLTLAYAITGHKAQGSEAPTVIVPVFRSRVLSREWLYTVITRAQERCYLIGDVQAIQSCIKVQRAQERRTGLVEAITRTGGN
jgi:exodeoxyribonuclease V alpha subunit